MLPYHGQQLKFEEVARPRVKAAHQPVTAAGSTAEPLLLSCLLSRQLSLWTLPTCRYGYPPHVHAAACRPLRLEFPLPRAGLLATTKPCCGPPLQRCRSSSTCWPRQGTWQASPSTTWCCNWRTETPPALGCVLGLALVPPGGAAVWVACGCWLAMHGAADALLCAVVVALVRREDLSGVNPAYPRYGGRRASRQQQVCPTSVELG